MKSITIVIQKEDLVDCNYNIESSVRNGIQKIYYDFNAIKDICIKANLKRKWIYYKRDEIVLKVKKYRKDKKQTSSKTSN